MSYQPVEFRGLPPGVSGRQLASAPEQISHLLPIHTTVSNRRDFILRSGL
jgi:hypothetical protein